MNYTIIDYIFGIIITLLVYDLVPAIISIKCRNLKLRTIRIISIINYIVGYGFFYLVQYSTGSIPNAGAAFFWSFIGYYFMKKYSLNTNIPESNDKHKERIDGKQFVLPDKDKIITFLKPILMTIMCCYIIFSITYIYYQKGQIKTLSLSYESMSNDYDSLKREYDLLESYCDVLSNEINCLYTVLESK